MTYFTDKNGYLIDNRLRQRMAPAMKRMLEYMEANPGKYGDVELAEKVFCARDLAKRYLKWLYDAGILKIAGYRRTGAIPQALYAFAFYIKKDAPRPRPMTRTEECRRRVERLKSMYGEHAWRVRQSRNRGGAETLVIEGKVVYRRGR